MFDQQTADTQAVIAPSGGALAPLNNALQGLSRFGKNKPLGAVGGVIFLALVLVAIFAPLLAPYGPKELVDTREGKAAVHIAPNSDFLWGTDHVGRDVLSRVIHGARVSLYVGIGSVLIGITGAFILGVAFAYAGGKADLIFQRFVDAMMALPGLIIALAIMAVLGPSLNNIIIAIVVGLVAPVVRTVRSQVLSLKELDYVLAATAVGASSKRIIFRHIVPNCFATYLILATYYLGFAIIIEAGLSFLGVGSPPDVPSWGGMLTIASQSHVKIAPWVGIFPGVAIFIVVLGFNLLGDALRDVFDPKLRGR